MEPPYDRAASAPVRKAALEVLLGDDLEPIVDLVASSPEPGCYEVHAHDGMVRFTRSLGSEGPTFSVEAVEGRNPIGDQDEARFATLAQQEAGRYPERKVNAYPHAYDHVAQVWDHRCAPDLCVVHSAAHNWEERGGHRGEHGALDVVQARAPFIISGKGAKRLGTIDASCRLVDVAPTILAALGAEPAGGIGPGGEVRADAYLARQDGRALTELLDADRRPAHVIGILFDGCNPSVLYDMAAAGEAPTVARLMQEGTTLLRGAFACLPTVTLANHTSILTGCLPGHHGVLHNAWYDRELGEQVVTESPSTWHTSMRWLAPGVETLHEAAGRLLPGSFTVSTNEPADRGAGYSTFEMWRQDRAKELFPDMSERPPHTDAGMFTASHDYQWATWADHLSMTQATGIWRGDFLGRSWARPALSWFSFTLTDAAFHAGGPFSDIARASVRDADARLGAVLDAVGEAGVLDDTMVLLVADHGMEESNPAVTGDWDAALEAAGITFRDESGGFLYL